MPTVKHKDLTGANLHWPKPHDSSYHTDYSSTGAQIDAAVGNSHPRQHGMASTSDHTGISITEDNLMSGNADGLPKDSGLATTDVAAAVADTHPQKHDIDSTADHNGVSGATAGNVMAFNANGLPADGLLAVTAIVNIPSPVATQAVRRNAANDDWEQYAPTDTDEKVKSDATDPTAGYLDAKVDNSSIEVNATAHTMNVKAGGVTLAMMANLAQDKIIGRETGSTGAPEAIDCTANGRKALKGQLTISPNSSSPVSVTAGMSGNYFTNEGASGEINFNLPTPAAGLQYWFACQDSDGIKVTATGSGTIRVGNSVSIANGYISSSTVGSIVHMVALNATEWFCESTGSWTVETA